MDAKALSSICDQVYQKYPEVNGIRPKLQSMSKGTATQHVLIFSGKATTESGRSMERIVRVVVSADGKILKMSTSK